MRTGGDLFFFGVVFTLWAILVFSLADLLWQAGMQPLEWVQLLLFAILSVPIVLGAVMCAVGFWLEFSGGDPLRITALPTNNQTKIAEQHSLTAVIIPIFNEDTNAVFARVRAMFESVEEIGARGRFHFFILSDSNDENIWIAEETAWMELCREIKCFGEIFYRKRRLAINKKSGNVADFCRRWGRRYHYMITLDADSLMEGFALVQLVELMDKHPKVGIIQTATKLIRGESLFARTAQYVVEFYGRFFCAGLNFWQQGQGLYWGHNAIIRLAPFIENCDLPNLPGAVPFGGHILSHDFVEAALIQRAGYSVWLAYDIAGSYEEGPPNWIDYIKRDRRWCAGNLQHVWLLFSPQISLVNKLHLLLGVLSYVTSPLWATFILATVLQYFENLRGGPEWEKSFICELFRLKDPETLATAIFLFVVMLILLPRLLSWIQAGISVTRKNYGGYLSSLLSSMFELCLSTLAAPVHMLMNTKFVIYTALGQTVTWGTQNRESGEGTSWSEAWAFHSTHTLVGLILSATLLLEAPEILIWLTPLLAGLVFSAPLSVLSSKPWLGQMLKKIGLFLTPVEITKPRVVEKFELFLKLNTEQRKKVTQLNPVEEIIRVIIDPYINAVHIAFLRRRSKRPTRKHEYLVRLAERFLINGPASLTKRERMALLQDYESMDQLHKKVWQTPSTALHHSLAQSLQRYNLLTG